ncbi:hypothetical protein [Algoriphagus sp.]|uniref:hypothetical protein n=1 Tax=Algoriphagus sp. TaxID=1872435 RepID=UPI00261FBB96|nr:hypothetical protein [Algoriphagus sp.]
MIPFTTHGGYNIGSSFDTLEESCEGCLILSGFSIRGGYERDGILVVIDGEKEIKLEKGVKNGLAA